MKYRSFHMYSMRLLHNQAVSKLSVVTVPFFMVASSSLFLWVSLTWTMQALGRPHENCVIKDGSTEESCERETTRDILWHPWKFTATPLGTMTHSLRTTDITPPLLGYNK